MPRIRCHYLDCVFLDEGICTAGMVELDPDTGCKTYSPNAEAATDEDWDSEEDELEEWDDMEEEGEEDWEDMDFDEEN